MSLVLLILGLLLVFFSHPKIRQPIMSRLFNEGIVQPKEISAEKVQIVKNTNPNFTILFIGISILLAALMIRDT